MESKVFKKYLKLIQNKDHVWTDNEIIYFRKAIGSSGIKDPSVREKLLEHFNNSEHYFLITEEQSNRGIQWLRNFTFKKDGSLRNRKDMPFTEKEAEIINNFSHFFFVGVHNESNNAYQFYSPIYRVVAKNGESFDYSTNMGIITLMETYTPNNVFKLRRAS